MMHSKDREDLKKAVRAVTPNGLSNKHKRKFKKMVARSLARQSALIGNALRLQVDEAHTLIDELWDEVRNEQLH